MALIFGASIAAMRAIWRCSGPTTKTSSWIAAFWRWLLLARSAGLSSRNRAGGGSAARGCLGPYLIFGDIAGQARRAQRGNRQNSVATRNPLLTHGVRHG